VLVLGNIDAVAKTSAPFGIHVNGNVDLRIEKARDPGTAFEEKNMN